MASAGLGEFGPTDGQPVLYYFNPLYHVQGIIPWLLLPLAFVAIKENRTAQAAWILAPIALLAIVYWAVINVLQLDSGGTVQLRVMFTILVLGFSLVWLLAERIGKRNRFLTLLLATLICFGSLGVNLLSGGFGDDMISIASFAAVSILAIIVAFVVAALNSSKRFRIARFIIFTGVALFGSLLIIISAITFIFFLSPNRPMSSQIAEVLGVSFFSSLVYFVGLSPFLVLLFVSPFWRKRFDCVTGIRASTQ